jgi:hypothetical protein
MQQKGFLLDFYNMMIKLFISYLDISTLVFDLCLRVCMLMHMISEILFYQNPLN